MKKTTKPNSFDHSQKQFTSNTVVEQKVIMEMVAVLGEVPLKNKSSSVRRRF